MLTLVNSLVGFIGSSRWVVQARDERFLWRAMLLAPVVIRWTVYCLKCLDNYVMVCVMMVVM